MVDEAGWGKTVVMGGEEDEEDEEDEAGAGDVEEGGVTGVVMVEVKEDVGGMVGAEEKVGEGAD